MFTTKDTFLRVAPGSFLGTLVLPLASHVIAQPIRWLRVGLLTFCLALALAAGGVLLRPAAPAFFPHLSAPAHTAALAAAARPACAGTLGGCE